MNPPQHEAQRDPLAVPSPEILRDIAAKQDARAQAIRARRAQELQMKRSVSNSYSHSDGLSGSRKEQAAAAEVIQRNYRGYRERRAMEGWGVSGGDRWLEV